jgi:hypothetical protein
VAVAIYFHPNGMSLEQFNEIHRRLNEAGAGTPPGRIHHSCFGTDGDLMVYDIWESPETFETFGKTLMPILAELGVDAGEPAILEIHRLDQSKAFQES